MHAPTVAKNVVDLLVTIARHYPGHFIPHALRKVCEEAKIRARTASNSNTFCVVCVGNSWTLSLCFFVIYFLAVICIFVGGQLYEGR